MIRAIQETAFRFPPVRLLVGLFFLVRGTWFRLTGNEYRFLSDYCRVARVARVWPAAPIAQRAVLAAVARLKAGPNTLIESYRSDRASAECAALFSLTGKGPHDLFRDLIVLKSSTSTEKGVILLKYARTFDAVVALFDLQRLMDRYVIVLEPCWAGYWDPSLLMYVTAGTPVIVQCFTQDDLEFVTRVGWPLVPVTLGPADWVDADLFKPPARPEKSFDLVMVANWAPHKRHAQLFRALSTLRDRHFRVLLIGFPWGGRTAADVRLEAAALCGQSATIEVVERVPAAEVATHVGRCKAFVFLSKKEGDNKALVEAMFVGVPAIVYDRTVGGAAGRINAQTGVLSSDADLGRTIVRMVDGYRDFSPREWALAHTGSAIATRILEQALTSAAGTEPGRPGIRIAEKTNSPNLAYKNPQAREQFQADYAYILSVRRPAEP